METVAGEIAASTVDEGWLGLSNMEQGTDLIKEQKQELSQYLFNVKWKRIKWVI